MLDHVGLTVSDLDRSKAFYSAALGPIGYELAFEFEEGAGFGSQGMPDFWISRGEPKTGTHVAFQVGDRQQVHAFHEAAVAAGGTDNGEPGPRPQYSPTYYAAYVHDPDGHNIEAVCHQAE